MAVPAGSVDPARAISGNPKHTAVTNVRFRLRAITVALRR